MMSCQNGTTAGDTGTHIIDDGIRLGHQASDSGGVHDLTVRARETGPERAHVHLKLVEAVEPYAVEQRVEVVLEPRPDLARRDALRRRRVRAQRLLDVREVGHLPDAHRVRRRAHQRQLDGALRRGGHREGRIAWASVASDGRLGGERARWWPLRGLCLRQERRRGRRLLVGEHDGLLLRGAVGEVERVALGRARRARAVGLVIVVVVGSLARVGLLAGQTGRVDGLLCGIIVGLPDVVL